MDVFATQTSNRSKELLDVLYLLTIQQPPHNSVVLDLNKQLQDTHKAYNKVRLSVFYRALKWERHVDGGPQLSARQMATDRKQKEYAMWFKIHMRRLKSKINEIEETIAKNSEQEVTVHGAKS